MNDHFNQRKIPNFSEINAYRKQNSSKNHNSPDQILSPFVKAIESVVESLSSINSELICTTPGCNNSVSKAGYKFCYSCWKANQSKPNPKPEPEPKSSPIILLSATKISEQLSIPKNQINSIFAELGLLSKQQNGWVPTKRGLGFGAVQKNHPQTGNSYVLWPEAILDNQVFLATIETLKGNQTEPSELSFREKFQSSANLRTTDGHWVRSKAEVMIDNWLYMMGLVHAYERRLPIEEEAYCDFYIPAGKVYIEYWGYENNPEYLERKKIKQRLYQKYDLNLIELSEQQVRNLDDELPQLLLPFGVTIN